MAKYHSLTTEEKAVMTIKSVQSMIAKVLLTETNAECEVTIAAGSVMVYTENLGKLSAVKSVMAQTRELEREVVYEADVDGPAGATLTYSL